MQSDKLFYRLEWGSSDPQVSSSSAMISSSVAKVTNGKDVVGIEAMGEAIEAERECSEEGKGGHCRMIKMSLLLLGVASNQPMGYAAPQNDRHADREVE